MVALWENVALLTGLVMPSVTGCVIKLALNEKSAMAMSGSEFRVLHPPNAGRQSSSAPTGSRQRCTAFDVWNRIRWIVAIQSDGGSAYHGLHKPESRPHVHKFTPSALNSKKFTFVVVVIPGAHRSPS